MNNPSTNHNNSGLSVVVALGFGDADGLAFDRAVRIARRVPRSHLNMIHVFPEQPSPERARELVDHLRLYVNEKAATLTGLQGMMVGIHLRHGKIDRELVQFATETRADFLVLGAQEHPHLKSWLVGSTAEHLLATAPCAVVIAAPPPKISVIHDPAIEPPCPDCMRTRDRASGAWWCERHLTHARAGHTFSYRRELPLAMHDSEVIPTGVAM